MNDNSFRPVIEVHLSSCTALKQIISEIKRLKQRDQNRCTCVRMNCQKAENPETARSCTEKEKKKNSDQPNLVHYIKSSMTLNIPEEESSLVGSTGNQLEKVKNFVYLGALIATTERDLRVRKAKA